MKRIIALVLSLMLLISAGSAFAQAADAQDSALVVGTLTKMNGDFFAGLFSNNTSDIDVRALLHDAATIAWRENGNYAVNENIVALASVTAPQEGGDKTYTFTLKDNLYFSDGSRLTAKDYVFSVLLLSSAEIVSLGALNETYSALVGWEAFASGAGVFSGVRLLDDTTFTLTINSQYLPFFYELSFVDVTPYPMAVLAPGCDDADDGQGAYITGDFNAELLKATIMDAQTGYLTHPSVVTGPYVLVSYDADASVATFEKNAYYAGNFEGVVPEIERLTFKAVSYDDLIAQLRSGEIDIANKVSSASAVNALAEDVNWGALSTAYYLRSGFSFVAFACEQGLTSEDAVRHAIAMAIDAPAITQAYLGGYGQPVYGYYGYGQWMAAQQVEALSQLNLYEQDLGAALDLLIRAGFVFDSQGERYAQADVGTRYRAVDASGNAVITGDKAVDVENRGTIAQEDLALVDHYEPLTFSMAVPQNNTAASLVVENLEASFLQLSAELRVEALPMDTLLSHYYRQTERTYDMFFLASNFSRIFDPYYTYNTDARYQGLYNTSGLVDEELMQLAQDMRAVDAADMETYAQKWLAFQERWVTLLPMVPLYSNVYFDFYRADLYNYYAGMYSSWANAVVYATFTEPVEEVVPEDGEIIIE